MNEKLLVELRASLEFMSNTERKIASLILADPLSFTSMSLGELERRAEVSQGSIINFSNKYGEGGFPALKLAVAASLPSESRKPLSSVTSEDSALLTLKKTAEGLSEALLNTVKINSESALSEFAERILTARKIDIYGIYRSALVAQDLNLRLLELGVRSCVVGDVLTCALSASMLDEGDLVIAISASGKTQDILDAVKIAKERGAHTVAITGYTNSPLARVADSTLIAAASGASEVSEYTEIRVAQLAIIDSVASYLQCRIDNDGNKRYYKAKEILELHSERD